MRKNYDQAAFTLGHPRSFTLHPHAAALRTTHGLSIYELLFDKRPTVESTVKICSSKIRLVNGAQWLSG